MRQERAGQGKVGQLSVQQQLPGGTALTLRFRPLTRSLVMVLHVHSDPNRTFVSTLMLPARRRTSMMLRISTLAGSVPAALAMAALYLFLTLSNSALVNDIVTVIVT